MLQEKTFTNLEGAEAVPEPGAPSSEQGPSRNPYQSPLLVEWGSLVDLTGGPLADVQDDDFSGSGAF
ncbi:MAG: lasso RiPP family leader peptide-containing protein [Thermoanaerobaculia bacterium]